MSPDPLTISSCDRLASACVDAAMGFGGGAAWSGDSADPQSIISKGSAHQLADLIYRLAMADPPGPAFWTGAGLAEPRRRLDGRWCWDASFGPSIGGVARP